MHNRNSWKVTRWLAAAALATGCGGAATDAGADAADTQSATDATTVVDADGASDGQATDVPPSADVTAAADAVAMADTGAGGDAVVTPAACEPLTSAGCSADQQCFFTTPGTPGCVTPGTTAVGAACTSILACVKGALCINGKCGTICDASGANKALGCTAPGYCGLLTNKSGAPLGGNLGVCFGGDNCNPVTNAGCSAGDACDPGGAATFCQKPGTVAVGGACLGPAAGDCTADALCIGASGTAAGVCEQRCDTTATSPCPTGQKCGGVTSGGTKVGNNFGVCK